MIDLSGKTAVVTGGSRGIGRAVCLALAGAGANVVVGYQHAAEAAQEVCEAVTALGTKAVAHGSDLAKETNIETLFGLVTSSFGSADIVVANAGIWKRAPIDTMTSNQWRETMNTNLDAVFYTCRQAIRHMKSCGGGKLILISSTAGQQGEANYCHYAATKGAIIALTRSLGVEVGPYNINVNCVAPGWVDTEMTREVLDHDDFRAEVEASIPLGRIATPEDIAGPVLFLASSLSIHMQGQILGVNGGSVLQ